MKNQNRMRSRWFKTVALILVGVFAFTSLPQITLASRKNAPEFKAVDDFNSGIGSSDQPVGWQKVATPGATIDILPEAEDSLNLWGGSARIDYTIPADGNVAFSTALDHIDMSQAIAIVILFRADELQASRVKVGVRLSDYRGNTGTAYVNRHLVNQSETSVREIRKGWLEAYIPLRSLEKLNFDRLTRLEVIVSSDEAITGSLIFDELSFFGYGDVIYESLRDNLIGSPEETVLRVRRKKLIKMKDDDRLLRAVAKDTWGYFENVVDTETGLPLDHIRIGRNEGLGNYTGPTNIAMYWLSLIAAMDLEFVDRPEVIERIQKSLKTLKRLERWDESFWLNFFNTRSGQSTISFVSTVDNAWLAAALIVVRQTFEKELGYQASQILEALDFSKFYDKKKGQFSIGFDRATGKLSPNHYGLIVSEARLASYIAVGKGDVDLKHWYKVYRTLPKNWDWQRQVPSGSKGKQFGVRYFAGHYTYLNRKFVPSWGGSLFEFLSPTLVVDESKYGKKSFAKNNKVATDLHIEYASKVKDYPVWGMAPAAIQNGKGWKYEEYGVPDLGAKWRRGWDLHIAPLREYYARRA